MQRTGWFHSRAPGSACAFHSLRVTFLILRLFLRHLGWQGVGRAVHWGAPLAQLHPDGCVKQTRSRPAHRAVGHEGPAGRFGEIGKCGEQLRMSPGHTWNWSVGRSIVSRGPVSQVTAASWAALGPQVRHLTVSQLPTGTRALPSFQAGMRWGGGCRRRIRSIKMEPKQESQFSQETHIFSPTPKMRSRASASRAVKGGCGGAEASGPPSTTPPHVPEEPRKGHRRPGLSGASPTPQRRSCGLRQTHFGENHAGTLALGQQPHALQLQGRTSWLQPRAPPMSPQQAASPDSGDPGSPQPRVMLSTALPTKSAHSFGLKEISSGSAKNWATTPC